MSRGGLYIMRAKRKQQQNEQKHTHLTKKIQLVKKRRFEFVDKYFVFGK